MCPLVKYSYTDILKEWLLILQWLVNHMIDIECHPVESKSHRIVHVWYIKTQQLLPYLYTFNLHLLFEIHIIFFYTFRFGFNLIWASVVPFLGYLVYNSGIKILPTVSSVDHWISISIRTKNLWFLEIDMHTPILAANRTFFPIAWRHTKKCQDRFNFKFSGKLSLS